MKSKYGFEVNEYYNTYTCIWTVSILNCNENRVIRYAAQDDDSKKLAFDIYDDKLFKKSRLSKTPLWKVLNER